MGFGAIVRRRWRVYACGVCLLSSGAPGTAARPGWLPAKGRAAALPQRRGAEISMWERAERARDAFEAEPAGSRTKAEYARVMDAFRAIYHEAPQDMHAAEAVNAVAELLTEQGRGLRDGKALRAAVGQYEFLRTQYPGSSLRVGALLAEGQIEENELHDAAAARERYDLLLRQYPRSALVEEARAGLLSLDAARGGRGQDASTGDAMTRGVSGAPAAEPVGAKRGSVGGQPTLGGQAAEDGPPPNRAGRTGVTMAGAAGPRASGGEAAGSDVSGGGAAGSSTPVPVAAASTAARRKEPLATVTGIRHWSTPSYTRVAIDLGGEVEYEAARVPGPDRIYFDLHGAKLAQELVGKSFTVTDDGFLKKIRVAQSSGDMARIVLDVNDVTEYSAFLLPNPYRLIIDIHGGVKTPGAPMASMDSPAKQAAGVPNTRAVNGGSGADVARLSDQPGKVKATSVPTSQPISAVVKGREQGAARDQVAGAEAKGVAGPQSADQPDRELTARVTATGAAAGAATASRRGRGKVKASDARVVGDPAMPARAAVPTADGQTSLVRALGLKIGRIVIDAGHGGHDSGTLGVDGLEEKDVVLDVALRLGKLLHERLGAEVIYTRPDDTFVPLETRTAIANKAQADLFLSIHANSSVDASARGVETYYLNFTQQADALAVAARENAVSNQSIYQLSELVKKIALKEKIAESREFATDVESSLYGGLQKGNEGLKNRGVKKAPFVVLIGANMPSILAEISFVTNPKDAVQLREPEYRERVAESLYKGVARYAGGLGGTKPLATVAEQDSGQ